MCKTKKNGTIFYLIGQMTVCLLMQDGEAVARGLGIHSSLDLFDPKIGRDNAVSRAKEAYNRKSDCGEILLDAPRGNAYDWFDSSVAKDLFGDYKGYYQPSLTETEKRLLAKGCSKIDNADKLKVPRPVVESFDRELNFPWRIRATNVVRELAEQKTGK